MMREFVTPSIVTPTEGLLMGGGELYLAQQKLLKFKSLFSKKVLYNISPIIIKSIQL